MTQFLFAELGTSGSVDGSERLIIKGRFQQKQLEFLIRRYIGKFEFKVSGVCSMQNVQIFGYNVS